MGKKILMQPRRLDMIPVSIIDMRSGGFEKYSHHPSGGWFWYVMRTGHGTGIINTSIRSIRVPNHTRRCNSRSRSRSRCDRGTEWIGGTGSHQRSASIRSTNRQTTRRFFCTIFYVERRWWWRQCSHCRCAMSRELISERLGGRVMCCCGDTYIYMRQATVGVPCFGFWCRCRCRAWCIFIFPPTYRLPSCTTRIHHFHNAEMCHHDTVTTTTSWHARNIVGPRNSRFRFFTTDTIHHGVWST